MGPIGFGSGSSQPVYVVTYNGGIALENQSPSAAFNFSFSLDWAAELAPNGSLRAIAALLDPSGYGGDAYPSDGGFTVSTWISAPLYAASGLWTPNDSWSGPGPQWNISDRALGNISLVATFHLQNESVAANGNSTIGVKFDLFTLNWPWLNASDGLGVQVQSLAAGGAHFSYSRANATLEQRWNSDNSSYAGMEFGPTAVAANGSNGNTTRVAVHADTQLFSGGTPDRVAISLLSFPYAGGNYTNLSYDPTVFFGIPSGSGAGIGPTPPVPAYALAAVGASAVAIVAVLAALGFRRRRVPAEAGLAGLRLPPTV